MKAQRDSKTGKWLIQYRYTDWQGIRKKSTELGFEKRLSQIIYFYLKLLCII